MIYADNAATTRISDYAFEKMLPFLREQWGNPSSRYSLGTRAKRAIEQARKQFAEAIGAGSDEIIFTSGGTETNNWVLQSVARTCANESAHFITSSIEHSSVLNTCRALELCGIEVTYLPVDINGRVSSNDVRAAVKPNTKLVSIMLANNEVGTIQPIAEIGRILNERKILFHTDAVQAVGHIPVDVSGLQVDFLTASAHKFNGAKGTGFLFKRSGLELSPLVFGGEQEHGLRAGTENVAGIVAAGYATEECVAIMSETANKLNDMVDSTVKGIQSKIPTVRVNGDTKNCLPGSVNLSFDGVSGESLMHLLDLKGICISTSSACASGNDKPSHVLIAMGLTEQQAKSSIRITYGRYNAIDEVAVIVAAVCDAYDKIKSSQ